MELTKETRNEILKGLKVENYSQGPIAEKLYGGADMWVFGKKIKKKEVYIKISIGDPSSNVICISFHIAEYPMKYPFRL